MPLYPIDITPNRDAPKPEPKEMVPVLLVDGVLNSGRPFSFNVRADLGDQLVETPEALSFTFGTSGETIEIQRSQIAVLSKSTRQVPKPQEKKEKP